MQQSLLNNDFPPQHPTADPSKLVVVYNHRTFESLLENYLQNELAQFTPPDSKPVASGTEFSKFAYSSAMQKSIRRGYADDATQYAISYHRQDPEGFWRRLVVVACEDVALGGALETALTMVAAKSKVWRRKNGDDEKVIRYLVPKLAGAVKDRSSCDFMQLLWHHPRKHRDITTLRTASFQELSDFVLTERLPTSFRACAAWLLAGTDRFENKHLPLRSGSRGIFNATMEQMNVPALIRYIAIRGTVACRYPMALLHPFMWQMQNKSLYVSIEKTDFPNNREYIAGLPSETWDQYVREGKQSFAYFGKVCKTLDNWLTRRGITGSDARMAAIGAVIFICEGAKLNRRLLFEGVDEITEAVELIDYRNVGLTLNDGRELAQLILENHKILHLSRQKAVAG